MKKLFLLLLAVFAITLSAQAQRVVTGTVLSAEDNEPLPGATVLPVGGGQGVATDVDGNFSLNVPNKVDKITVTYVGYTPQTIAIKPGKMTIKLESSDKMLDEVMVVAYGTAKKSAFTGSATVVGEAQIEKVQVSNVLDALSGVVPGVQLNNASGAPGSGSPTIRIRGISSINAGNSPLVVVDGVPYSGDINNFSAADIESMTVLKDAASNALYGARGANGVILITTKKGKGGSTAKVTLDAKWGCNSRAQVDYQTINDPAGYYEMYYRYLNNYALSQGMTPEAANLYANENMIDPSSGNNRSLGYNVFTLPEGENLIGLDGRINPAATLGRTVNYKGIDYYLTPDNWLNDAYKHSLRQEYNVSVSNGDEKGSFFGSFSWLNNEGIVQNSGYQRMTGTLRADLLAKPWLKVGGNMNYARYKSNQLSEDGSSSSTANVFAAATQVAPIYPLYLRDGNGNIMVDSYGNTMYDYGDGMNANLVRPIFPQSNAIGESRLNENQFEGNAFNVTGFVEVRFLKDFKFTSNNNVAIDETRYHDVTNPYYGLYASSNGITYVTHGRSRNYTFQQLLNWNRAFGVHNVAALVGHENYWAKSASLSGGKSNMFDPTNWELAGAITDISASSSSSAYNNEGWIFRGQYDFDSRIFASASFRRDASSRFHPDHRWGSFWSFGAAWLISKEKFFQAPWVDQLKLKASYGEQGNDNIGSYRYTNTYVIVNAANHPAAKPNSMGNPNITWEKGGNLNYGVEFSLWNQRLSGSIEGFYRKTTDMLFSFPLPPSFGFSSYYANIGDMSNRGVEIDLQATLFANRDWNISVNGNLTYYTNKIDRLPAERRTMTCDGVEGFSSGNFFYGEGESIYTFRLPKYAGVDKATGMALYYKSLFDEEGNVIGQTVTSDYNTLDSQADQHLCGTALPPCYGGFGLNAQYRWFDFSIDFNYQIGGKTYDGDYAGMMSCPSTNGGVGTRIHKDMLNAWSYDNPGSDLPRAMWGDQYTTSTSDRWLVSASYLSLRSLNFGFTLPKSVTNKLQLDKVRLYLSADNIAYWTARKGLDPRQSIAGSSTNSYYSPIRTVSGGINVTF